MNKVVKQREREEEKRKSRKERKEDTKKTGTRKILRKMETDNTPGKKEEIRERRRIPARKEDSKMGKSR